MTVYIGLRENKKKQGKTKHLIQKTFISFLNNEWFYIWSYSCLFVCMCSIYFKQ